MPPSFPTTSPVAVATARILEAYLSRHKLSPAEAASLGGKIAETLANLTSGAGAESDTQLARAQEPAPKRQSRPREPRAAGAAVSAETFLTLEPEGVGEQAPIPESLREPEPEPEPVAMAEHVDDDREFEHGVASASPQPEAQADTDQEVPRKRKRPSRPRSRRGKGAGAPVAFDALPGDEASGEEASAQESPENGGTEPVTGAETDADDDPRLSPESGAVKIAPGHSGAAPKPRRTASPGRRDTAS